MAPTRRRGRARGAGSALHELDRELAGLPVEDQEGGEEDEEVPQALPLAELGELALGVVAVAQRVPAEEVLGDALRADAERARELARREVVPDRQAIRRERAAGRGDRVQGGPQRGAVRADAGEAGGGVPQDQRVEVVVLHGLERIDRRERSPPMSFGLTLMLSMSPCPRAVQLTIVSGDWSWQMSTLRSSNWLIMKAPNAQRM